MSNVLPVGSEFVFLVCAKDQKNTDIFLVSHDTSQFHHSYIDCTNQEVPLEISLYCV